MRDLPPDESPGLHRPWWRWMNRGMLALVSSAMLLGLVLIVYFVMLPSVDEPLAMTGRAGKHPGGSHPLGPALVVDSEPPAAGVGGVAARAAGRGTAVAPGAVSAKPATVAASAAASTPERTRVRVESSRQPAASDPVRIDFIVASVVQSPRYQLEGGGEKPFRPGSWLQVEVDFTTFPEAIDELTLNYVISLPGEAFSGEIQHAPLAAGAHRSVAYLVPRQTEQFLTDGKLPPQRLKSVFIEAVIDHRTVGTGFIGREDSIGRHPRPGFIRSLEQTPFLPLAGGQYEPAVSPAPVDVKRKEQRAPVPERAPRFTQTSTSIESPTR